MDGRVPCGEAVAAIEARNGEALVIRALLEFPVVTLPTTVDVHKPSTETLASKERALEPCNRFRVVVNIIIVVLCSYCHMYSD